MPEILVTAQRRPEPLQRTPVSVIALSGKDLESRSATNTRALQNFVPNLTFAPSQNVGEAGGNVFIRGIGQEDFGIGAEAGVGLYVDGVYYPRALGTIMNLTDIDRIEVLRGPQGTLFGKNTLGGAISIFTQMPRPGRERRFKAILGNDDRLELRSISNEQLSNRVFVRLSIGLVSRDGYMRRLPPPAPLAEVERVNATDADFRSEGSDRSQAGRVQLRWLVSDALTADFSLDGSRRRNTQSAEHLDFLDPRFGIFPDLNRLIGLGSLPGPQLTNDLVRDSLLESFATGGNSTRQSFWGGSAVLARTVGPHTLKLTGAYRGLRSRIDADADLLYFNDGEVGLRVNHRQYSGELQLSRNSGRLVYTVGAFLFGETSKLLPTEAIGEAILVTCGCFYAPGDLPEFTAEPRQLRSDSYAGYAQATYQLTEALSATLGGRYSHEKKTLDGKVLLLDANYRVTDIVLDTGHSEDAWNSFTYRAGAEYQLASNLMAYGSVASGFKSGGFNVRGDPNLPNMGFYSFKPETALTYELGARSEWFGRKLRVNVTLFQTDYNDIQLRQQTIVNGEFATLIENAAKARIRGAEVEVTAVPAKGLTLGAAYGHLDPKFLDVANVRRLTLDSRFQRTPRNSFSASINYELPVRSATVELHADYGYRSKEQFQIIAALNDQRAYGLLGARLTLRARDDRWSVALFGTNLTDERYRTAGRGTLIQQAGFAYSSVGMPRQFGVQVASRF